MEDVPIGRLVLWLGIAAILIEGLSFSIGNWINPHWDASAGAWATASNDAYWDPSSQQWLSDLGGLRWDPKREVWVARSGAYVDGSGQWRDRSGDRYDAKLGVWVDPRGTQYWDNRQMVWRPLPPG